MSNTQNRFNGLEDCNNLELQWREYCSQPPITLAFLFFKKKKVIMPLSEPISWVKHSK